MIVAQVENASLAKSAFRPAAMQRPPGHYMNEQFRNLQDALLLRLRDGLADLNLDLKHGRARMLPQGPHIIIMIYDCTGTVPAGRRV